MATKKKTSSVPADVLAAARRRAEEARRQLEHSPGPAELLTPQELADAAPFYFVLRDYIRQLKSAREAAGLTLADVSERSGMAVESLSRLETGAQTNPTWKTLGLYAAAVARRPRLSAEVVAPESGKGVGGKGAHAGESPLPPPTASNTPAPSGKKPTPKRGRGRRKKA
jgi:transcriptional regulator with XRE-family HTH domain